VQCALHKIEKDDYAMQCPKCGSDNTQRFEVANQAGTHNTTSTGKSAGLGFSGGRVGVAGGVSSTSGQTQTSLARTCAPPEKQKTRSSIFIGGIMVFVALYAASVHWYLSLIVLPLGVFALKANLAKVKFNSTEWPKLYKLWTESWICHKCGNAYHQPLP
jgi:predicted nucleic-acid-binding Zn-ribbon protein